MSSANTEGTLRDWRNGSTQAERLCAALLHLESFEDVDPQHPLGGPDGLKDVRCNRNGKVWIAAAILAAPKLNQYEGGKMVPATVCAIANAIRWAEEIMREIDRHWPLK